MKTFWTGVSFVILISNYSLYAATSSGAAFLKMGVGAHGLSMGDAITADTAGSESLFWNPAGLVDSPRPEIFFNYFPSVEAVRQEQVAFSYASKKIGWGVGYQGVGYDSMNQTDDAGNKTGEFTAGDQAFVLGLAKRVGLFKIGLNGKYVTSSIQNISASAWGFDGGVLLTNPLWPSVQHALVIKNAGSSLKFINESTPLPFRVTLGNQLKLIKNLKINVDLIYGKSESGNVGSGLEYTAFHQSSFSAVVRGGYTTQRNKIDKLSGASLGGGIFIYGLSLDFAWVPFGELGSSQSMTLVWRMPASLFYRPEPKKNSTVIPSHSPSRNRKSSSSRTKKKLLDLDKKRK